MMGHKFYCLWMWCRNVMNFWPFPTAQSRDVSALIQREMLYACRGEE